jgi:hypothetical protein
MSKHRVHIDSVRRNRRLRRGAATLDYVLVLAVVLPMIAFVLRIAPRIMGLVYEMTSVLISWPFL